MTSLLKQTCLVFRREVISISNVDVLEDITIVSACNKVLRKRFTIPNNRANADRLYSCNDNHSKKALMWLVHNERTDGCRISHGRNGREFKLPELPHITVDGYCHET